MKRITLLTFLVLAACSRGAPPQASVTAAPVEADSAPPSSVTTARSNAAAPAPTSPAVDTPPLAHWDGYGDVHFGMTPAAAQKAWGGQLAGDPADRIAECGYLQPKQARPTLAFMFEKGRLVRYDVESPKDTAPGGGRVGMPRSRVEALYPGQVEARPHHYVPRAHYLRVRDPQKKDRALVFETDAQGTVTRWRIGLAPAVDYIEGCS